MKKGLIVLLIMFSLGICIYLIYNTSLKKLYPKEFEEYVSMYSKKYDIEENWIYALIKAESNFDENSISQSGAIGLMQLMESTAKEVAEELKIENIDLKNPKCNIEIGTKYFKTLLDYYDDNYCLAITAYNAGIGTVNKWIESKVIKKDGTDIENIPYKETNNYIRKVLKNYRTYNKIY